MAKECHFRAGIEGGTKGGQRKVNKEEYTKKWRIFQPWKGKRLKFDILSRK